MGRTSKFTFPYPGRKRETKTNEPVFSPPPTPGLNLSKAQKILGAADLNIDSPNRDDASYQSYRPPSRGMSITISDSTHDDVESGVLPRHLIGKASSTLLGHGFHDDVSAENSSMRRLRGEVSNSTLRSHYDRQKSPLAISQQTSASSIRDKALRKGFPPVAPLRSPILEMDDLKSQMLTEEQHRVIRAAIAQVEKRKPNRLDLARIFSKSKRDSDATWSPTTFTIDPPIVMSPSAMSTSTMSQPGISTVSTKTRVCDADGSRKLMKQDSRGNLAPPNEQAMMASPELFIPRRVASRQQTRLANETYQQPPPAYHPASAAKPPQPDFQPKSVPTRTTEHFRSPLVTDEQFSWNTVRADLHSPTSPWDKQSVTSSSSRNTRESRRTTVSVFSNSDLRNNSVLSLSSDEESNEEIIIASPRWNVQSMVDSSVQPSRSSEQHAPTRNVVEKPMNVERKPTRSVEQQNKTRKAEQHKPKKQTTPPAKINTAASMRMRRIQDEKFLTIPMISSAGSRISGPWNPKRTSIISESPSSPPDSPLPDLQEFNRDSLASDGSSSTNKTSRFMSVTKQEEALLEALRQKRARMKDEVRKAVIAEQSSTKANNQGKSKPPSGRKGHGTRDSKSSIATLKPAISHANNGKFRNRDSSTSSQRTATRTPMTIDVTKAHRDSTVTKTSQPGTGHILLYLDRPIPGDGSVETAEPSPDLSDFLSFGSDDDEDETPRTSWVEQHQRPDSLSALGPNMPSPVPPLTPKGAARLSAVGAFAGQHSLLGREGGAERRGKGVAFVEEVPLRVGRIDGDGVERVEAAERHDFLNEDEDVIWGM